MAVVAWSEHGRSLDGHRGRDDGEEAHSGRGDIGSYLRATVTYTDSIGDQTVSGVTDNPVEARTLANAAPEFDEDDIDPIRGERERDENGQDR